MRKDNWIPLYKPYLSREEEKAVLEVLKSGDLGGNGKVCKKVEGLLQNMLKVRHALLTTSCTHALELALMSLNVEPNDEVILPSFTFSTTATCIIRQGGRPVFADIEPDTLNIDIEDVVSHITPRTRAIIPVHYAGQGCDMSKLLDIADKYKMAIIEDAAHGIGARFSEKYLGTIGTVGCISFHISKNITCGEGGVYLTDDEKLAFRAEIIREKGTNRSQFLRGDVDKYSWIDVGSSFVLSDVLAAILAEQLKKMMDINSRRRAICERYVKAFTPLVNKGQCSFLRFDQRAEHNGHIFAILVNPAKRDSIIKILNKQNIGATFHFIPLHLSPYGQQLGYRAGDLPITEKASNSLIRLPVYPQMVDEEFERVVNAVFTTFGGRI